MTKLIKIIVVFQWTGSDYRSQAWTPSNEIRKIQTYSTCTVMTGTRVIYGAGCRNYSLLLRYEPTFHAPLPPSPLQLSRWRPLTGTTRIVMMGISQISGAGCQNSSLLLRYIVWAHIHTTPPVPSNSPGDRWRPPSHWEEMYCYDGDQSNLWGRLPNLGSGHYLRQGGGGGIPKIARTKNVPPLNNRALRFCPPLRTWALKSCPPPSATIHIYMY